MAGAINPVNLTAPTPLAAASSPLLTQAQQLGLQQQIAESLLGQSMQPYSPIVHTGGGNPFARDVVNVGGIISQIANGLGGHYDLQQLAPKQAALAQMYQTQKAEDVKNVFDALNGHDVQVPTPDGQPYHVPGSVPDAARLAASSVIPEVQDLGKSLLSAWTEGQVKAIATPQDASAASRWNVPDSIAKSITPGLFGNTFDPSKWVTQPAILQGPGGAITTVEKKPGAIGQGAGVAAAPPIPPVAPGADFPTGGPPSNIPQPNLSGGVAAPTPPVNNSSGSFMQAEPGGQYKALTTPSSATTTDVNKGWTDRLEAGQQAGQKFVQTLPKFIQMLQLIPNSDLRWGGQQITQARMLATSLGVSHDDAQKIVDTQTYLKYALPQATAAGREFNARITNSEFAPFLQAFAANQDVDPRAAKNIIMQMIVDGYNSNTSHTNNVKTAGGLPSIGAQQAGSYLVPNFPSLDQVMGGIDQANIPVTYKVDKNTGMISNNEVGNNGALGSGPSSAVPAGISFIRNAQGKIVPAQ